VGLRVEVGGVVVGRWVGKEDAVETLVVRELDFGGLVGKEEVGGSGGRIVSELEGLEVGMLLCEIDGETVFVIELEGLVVGTVGDNDDDDDVVTGKLVVAGVEDEAGDERYQFALSSPRHSPTVTPVHPLARI
jgi:hypothetical protein